MAAAAASSSSPSTLTVTVSPCFTPMPIRAISLRISQLLPLKETLRGFKMILSGECDELPESAFLFAGTIDDVFAKAKKG